MRSEAFRPDEAGRVEAESFQVIFGGFEGLKEGRQIIFDGSYDIAAVTATGSPVSSPRAYCARASRRLLSMPL